MRRTASTLACLAVLVSCGKDESRPDPSPDHVGDRYVCEHTYPFDSLPDRETLLRFVVSEDFAELSSSYSIAGKEVSVSRNQRNLVGPHDHGELGVSHYFAHLDRSNPADVHAHFYCEKHNTVVRAECEVR